MLEEISNRESFPINESWTGFLENPEQNFWKILSKIFEEFRAWHIRTMSRIFIEYWAVCLKNPDKGSKNPFQHCGAILNRILWKSWVGFLKNPEHVFWSILIPKKCREKNFEESRAKFLENSGQGFWKFITRNFEESWARFWKNL